MHRCALDVVLLALDAATVSALGDNVIVNLRRAFSEKLSDPF
jgi:hypothetical protein